MHLCLALFLASYWWHKQRKSLRREGRIDLNTLQWNKLAKAFYDFKVIADKLGFYKNETNDMEKSLDVICPYPRELRGATAN